MAKRERHIHKLRRHIYKNGENIYFCVLNCRFKVHVKLSIGKVVLCNVCNQPFSMNERSSRMAKPNCDECSKTSLKALKRKREKELQTGKVEVSLDDLGIKLPELKGVTAPPKDSVVDLKSRMTELKRVTIPGSSAETKANTPGQNDVKISHSEDSEEESNESNILDRINRKDELL